jgi:hypothetical protein
VRITSGDVFSHSQDPKQNSRGRVREKTGGKQRLAPHSEQHRILRGVAHLSQLLPSKHAILHSILGHGRSKKQMARPFNVAF